MTKNQLSAYFDPAASWATNSFSLPQTPAAQQALRIVQKIMGKAAVQIPGVANVAAPPIPDLIFGLEDILQRVYASPDGYKIIVPVGVRRLCAAVAKSPCGSKLAQVIASPQPVQ